MLVDVIVEGDVAERVAVAPLLGVNDRGRKRKFNGAPLVRVLVVNVIFLPILALVRLHERASVGGGGDGRECSEEAEKRFLQVSGGKVPGMQQERRSCFGDER